MNLFRSEEDARNWSEFDESMISSLKPVSEWADIFATPFFRERGRADYISWLGSDAGRAAMGELVGRLPRRAE